VLPQVRVSPNSIPWPPLIYIAAAVTAVGLERLVPTGDLVPGVFRLAGFFAMAAGGALDCSAMLTMRRHHANILPHRAATNLVTSWPFSFTRNPIYLGNTVMLIGAAGAFSNVWFAAAAPLAVAAVTPLAVRREEHHMSELFGGSWRAYASRVPRWFRWRR
jgi:protein-S-isoprenylcysteine O-methyltransferase Ste14